MERFVLLVKFAQMLINWAIVDFYIAFCFVFYPVSQFVYKEEMFDKGMKYVFILFFSILCFFFKNDVDFFFSIEMAIQEMPVKIV